MIVQGTQIAQKILAQLARRIRTSQLRPHLGVVLVGRDPASQTYVRRKQQAAEAIGVRFSLFQFPAAISTAKLIAQLQRIQADPTLSGVIIQLPLPKGLDKARVLNALRADLDVDYLSWESLGKLVVGENPLVPPTPGAILEILRAHKITLTGRHVVLVGRGDLIGKPLANILMQQPLTLTVCNKQTRNLSGLTRQADILITGVGRAELITGAMVKKGAVVIDAGVSFRGKKMYGDVKFREVARVASLITPTPGGVGPVTVAKLLANTVANALKKAK
jgi:methylenetetrahydrofolate dehydrogenase (NADP+)/methenyltetrahydrofolate cyclohydrolase